MTAFQANEHLLFITYNLLLVDLSKNYGVSGDGGLDLKLPILI